MKKVQLPILDNYTTTQLQSLIDTATALIAYRESHEARMTQARQAIEALMLQHGLTSADLLQVAGKGAKKAAAGDERAKVAAKYRNTDNEQETWTGRGRTPTWLSAKVEAGHSRDEFLIAAA